MKMILLLSTLFFTHLTLAATDLVTLEKGQVVRCVVIGQTNYGAVLTGLGEDKVKLNAITQNVVEGDDKAIYLTIHPTRDSSMLYMVEEKIYEQYSLVSRFEVAFIETNPANGPLVALAQFSEATLVRNEKGELEETNLIVTYSFGYECQL